MTKTIAHHSARPLFLPTDGDALPHGPLEPVFNDIWFVRGGWDMPVPMKPRISRSMTVIRDQQSGELTLVNSMRLSEEGLRALENLGPIKHVIRLASMHGADDGFFRERYGAKIWALEQTQYTKGLTTDTHAGTYFVPDQGFDENSQLPIAEARILVMRSPRLSEASILLERNGGILLSGDYFHNTPHPDEFTSTLARVGMRALGLNLECNIGVGWFMMTKPSREDLLALLALEFDHVLPVHGLPVIGSAKERYRPAIEKFAAKARAIPGHDA